MIDVIESLMKGEHEYPRAFAAALPFWQTFYSEHENADDDALQHAIDNAQLRFQWEMEEKAGLTPPFAKSIMALTAVGALYKDGFEDEAFARRVLDRFVGSTSLSVDVKSAAREAARLYSLA